MDFLEKKNFVIVQKQHLLGARLLSACEFSVSEPCRFQALFLRRRGKRKRERAGNSIVQGHATHSFRLEDVGSVAVLVCNGNIVELLVKPC